MMVVRTELESVGMADFDSSDEDNEEFDLSPFPISWVDMSSLGLDEKLGISGLPGCKFKETWRSLQNDLECLKSYGIKEVFSLCTRGEFSKYRVPDILQEFTTAGLIVHHFPFPDGHIAGMNVLLKIVDCIKVNLMNGKRTLVHCFGGLGRSCLVAICLMMMIDDDLTPDSAIEKMRQLRGPGAVQSVKQYNFIQDFRQLLEEYNNNQEVANRSISR